MDKRLERILPGVQKPARYTGGEYNEIIKDKADVKLRMAFCFPDVYEIGMSNLGMRILYGCINAEPDIWCERVFAPGATWRSRCGRTISRSTRWRAATPSRSSTSSASRWATRWPIARCSTCWTWRASRSARRTGRTSCRSFSRAGQAAATRNPWRPSSTSWCSARARRWTSKSCASSKRRATRAGRSAASSPRLRKYRASMSPRSMSRSGTPTARSGR